MDSSSLKESLLQDSQLSSSTGHASIATADASVPMNSGNCKVDNHPTDRRPGEGLYCFDPSSVTYASIEKQLRRRTIIVGYVIFLNEACKGILFPILWSLCFHLGGNRFDQGLLVATFASGRVLLTTRMGIIADQYRHRAALLVSCCILIVGALTWTICYSTSSLAVLYVAQFLLGAGTATNGVCRSYVSERVAVEKRTNALSRLKAIQFAGFTLTVLLGCLIVVMGQSISESLKFTLPPLFLTVYACSSMSLLYFYFADIPPSKELHDKAVDGADGRRTVQSIPAVEEDDSNNMPHEDGDASAHRPDTKLSIEVDHVVDTTEGTGSSSQGLLDSSQSYLRRSYDYFALPETQLFTILVGNNVGTLVCLSAYETQLSRILLDDFHLSFIGLGLVVSCAGAVGVLMLVFFRELWTDRFRDIALVVGGFFALCAAQLFVLDWTADTRSSLWQFCLAVYLVYAFGYPIGAAANLGLFSTALGYGRQGVAQSLFVLSGSVTEVVFPIVSGVLEQYVKSNLTFSVVLLVVAARIVTVLVWYVLLLTRSNRSIHNVHGTPNSQPALFDDMRVRLIVGLIATILAVIGLFSFIAVSSSASR